MALDSERVGWLKLDDTRQNVLDFRGSLMLVEGPAGCGKTRLAVQRLRGAIDTDMLDDGQKVLCASFSRASRCRMKSVINTYAAGCAEETAVVTFDSFALSILRQYGDVARLSAPVRIRPNAPLDECICDGEGCHLSFDQVRQRTVELLRVPAIARACADVYPLVVVDEFQDTGRAHFEILMALHREGARLWAFGDTEQDINRIDDDAFCPHPELAQRGATRFELERLPDANRYRSPLMTRVVERLEEGLELPDRIRAKILKPYKREWGGDMPSRLGILLRKLFKNGANSICVLCRGNKQVVACSQMLSGTPKKWGGPWHHEVEVSDSIRGFFIDFIAAVWQALLSRDETVCSVVGRMCTESLPTSEEAAQCCLLPPPCPFADDDCVCSAYRDSITHEASRDLSTVKAAVEQLLDRPLTHAAKHCLKSEVEKAAALVAGSIPSKLTVDSPADVRRLFQKAKPKLAARLDISATATERGIKVMTVNQAKNREFDASVLIYNPRHGWPQDDGHLERMLVYQAASRARDAFHVLYHDGAELSPVLGPPVNEASSTYGVGSYRSSRSKHRSTSEASLSASLRARTHSADSSTEP